MDQSSTIMNSSLTFRSINFLDAYYLMPRNMNQRERERGYKLGGSVDGWEGYDKAGAGMVFEG